MPPTGDGTTILRDHSSHAKVQHLAVQRKYLHFSVDLRPWVMVRPRESNPRPAALKSSALPTELILQRIDWLIDALCKQKSRLADLPQRSKGSQCSEDFQGSKHFRRRSSAVGNDDVNPGDQHKAPIQNIPSVLQVRSRTNNKTMSDNL